jgi:hypothetical protein
MVLNVYVPVAGTPAADSIKKGSAIVADPADTTGGSGNVLVSFEGNLHGDVNLTTLKQKVEFASGRLVDNSPTAAKMAISSNDLVHVGVYDTQSKKLSIWGIHDGTVAKWVKAG